MRNQPGCLLALSALSLTPLAQAAGPPIDFDREVRPILSDKCYACHGPDEKKRMAQLRLDQKDGGAFIQRKDYRIVVPGDADQSRLFQRISSSKASFQMPPAYSGQKLSAAQIETIREWIQQGAKWEVHWAYLSPKRPEPPKVSNPGWVHNPIDAFVLAKLDAEGLKPSPQADKATLIRRVTLDLTGLPPTLPEINAFLEDQGRDAYEKVVDRLLQSPRYGERMAMEWLDLARYADTHGYHIDSHREMWHWRDWVIDAFNQNMPFDKFTIEQLAGDLLPQPTVPQRIATGFNRNNMVNFEGGAIPAEYQNEYVVDRVDATATTWLGITLGCARCHDHKYDPISQKDFYRFYAFFDNISELGLDGRTGNAKPYLELPSPEQKARLGQLEDAIAGLDKILDTGRLNSMQTGWEKSRLATLPQPAREGLAAHYEFDGSLSDSSGNYRYGRVERGDLTYSAGAVDRAATFDGDTRVRLRDGGALSNGPFSLAVWINPGSHQPMPVVTKLDDSASRRGVEVYLDDFLLTRIQHWEPRVYVRLIDQWPSSAIEIRTTGRLDPDAFQHVAVVYDGSGKASGLRVYIDGQPDTVEVLKDTLSGPPVSSAAPAIGDKAFGKPFQGGLDDLRIYSRALTESEIQPLALTEPVRATILIPPSHRSRGQKKRLRVYYLEHEAPPEIEKAWAERKPLVKERAALIKAIPSTMVMSELSQQRETVILARGDYRNRGEKVSPGVPSILPPLPQGAPANRLTLARWLVDPANPLTARVLVNRYWQMYFGLGIVKTPQDFGSQGDPPTNQPLLDWLATEFVGSGWDVRAMQRLIVTSAAYRQDSRTTPELLERDPENRLIAHGPRFRLPAEMVRDNALYVSGLLRERVGGPSVFPYQPKGLWEEVAFGDGFSAQSYTPSQADDLYRRSMYTFIKRSAPPPEMVTFDMPDREKCTARRLPTNTPLQALVLLNDVTYVEAARGLASRVLLEEIKSVDRRIDFAFRLATARDPQPRERSILRKLLRKETSEYKRRPGEAEKLLGVGESKPATQLKPAELAAWTTVASAILNLDETVTKE